MSGSAPALADLAVGTQLPAERLVVRRADLVAYAGASGDANPIHWSDRAAAAAGLDGVIAHGMLTMGLATSLLTRWCGDPAGVLDCSVVFTRPLLVPDNDDGVELEVTGRVTAVDAGAGTATVALTVTAGGLKVLGRSVAVLAVA